MIEADLLEVARAALEDAYARLRDISRLSNGEHEEIYVRSYYGNQTRALAALAKANVTVDATATAARGYPWKENHSFTPRGVNGRDRLLCARCGLEDRDQIHNGSLA